MGNSGRDRTDKQLFWSEGCVRDITYSSEGSLQWICTYHRPIIGCNPLRDDFEDSKAAVEMLGMTG